MSDKAVAVGHIPSGLFIVSVQDGDKKDGYLASWVQQVSFEPLVVAFTIKADRPGYEAIKSGKPFAINIVGDHETQYLRHFWSGYDPENSPFNSIAHENGENGGLFITDAKSSIECKYLESQVPGDHEVFFAEVLSSKVHSEEAKPKVHIRKTGLDY
ncbi:MAG: flavin reductase family protein [Bdellovibrionota bacterium]|jgi:flavin reductase (DIM6/NTAB) family NADH-FMN oxidoreductase RutF|nr:flavin reductase family protein [Bdellovibrionota bacterium]